jgi:hypothetical protein
LVQVQYGLLNNNTMTKEIALAKAEEKIEKYKEIEKKAKAVIGDLCEAGRKMSKHLSPETTAEDQLDIALVLLNALEGSIEYKELSNGVRKD